MHHRVVLVAVGIQRQVPAIKNMDAFVVMDGAAVQLPETKHRCDSYN